MDFTDAERADILTTADEMADAARAVTLRYFRSSALDISNKVVDHFDPVTIADREAEAAMRAILARRRPQDGILGEELGSIRGTSGLTWVIDPIDGTRSYMAGTPTWGVLIALSSDEGPIFGVIDQPHIGERFRGGLGIAELVGPRGRTRLAALVARPISEAVLFTTFPEVGSTAEGVGFRRVAAQVRLTRYGLDCYAYALVAAGQIDLVIEAGLQPYDVHAPIAVITAAGGIVTDWRGRPAHAGGRVLAAANRAIHAEALALLSAVPDAGPLA
jgi:histidinol phosphatase-like enzyme (inositol monophosphatase family)